MLNGIKRVKITMKKIFVLAVCLFVCSVVMAAQNNPPQNDSRYQWNNNNCKDAGVETRANNNYYMNGHQSQAGHTAPKGEYQVRTTVYDTQGNIVDQIHTNMDRVAGSKNVHREYNETVRATSECKWNK